MAIPAQVKLFGSPQISRGGELVAVDTRKAIAVVAYLALAAGSVSRDVLSFLFWPESDQTRARGALRRTLTSVRAAIGPDALVADRESVRLVRDSVVIDVLEFEELVARATGVSIATAATIYRGDLLDGFYVRGCPQFEDWQRTESARLRREADGVFASLVEDAARRGDHAAAIDAAQRRLDLDRLNEDAHRMVIAAEARAGHRNRAIDRYREAVRVLEDELGVAPLDETTALYEAVRKGDTPDPPRSPRRRSGTAGGLREAPPLIARRSELAGVMDVYRSSSAGGRFVVIEGESGIGKTRLVDEVNGAVAKEGGLAVSVRCHDGESDLPYAPLTQLLRELVTRTGRSTTLDPAAAAAVASLLPEFASAAVGPAPPGEGPAARGRFFDALRSAIVSMAEPSGSSLLVVDDLHLADRATADFIAYLGRRIATAPVAVVATWRRDEVPEDGPLPALIDGLVRRGEASIVRLGPLDDDAIERLVAAISPTATGTAALQAIMRLAGGNPFIAAEYATALAERGSLDERRPQPVHGLLAARLDRADESSRQVLAAAAVIGRAFTPELMRAVSGRQDDEVADALDDLEAKALITRDGAPGSATYDFANDQLREVAYEQLGAGRRRLLHARAAEHLSTVAGASPTGVGEAAHHAGIAGDPVLAGGLYREAGRLARAVHANAEATEYYSTALTLGHDGTQEIREALGDLAVLAGDYRRAIGEYEAVASHAVEADLARIEHKLGRLLHRRGDWQAAESYLAAALEQSGNDIRRVEILSDLAANAYRRGETAVATERADQALALADKVGDAAASSRASNVSGLMARAGGDLTGAAVLLERSRELASGGGDGELYVAALNNLARTRHAQGDHEAAMSLLGEAVDRCRALGDRHREAALLSNLGDAQHAVGLTTDSADSVRRSAEILAEIGVDGEDFLPEMWMLTEW